MTFDVGPHLFTLGLLYIFRFVIVGFIVAGLALLAGAFLLPRLNLYIDLTSRYIWIGILLLTILIIVSL